LVFLELPPLRLVRYLALVVRVSIFRSLKDFLKPRPPAGKPYGLTTDKIERLKALRSNSNWSVYAELLDTITTMYAEAILISGKHSDQDLNRGIVLGIRKAGLVIDELMRAEKEQANLDGRRESGHEANLLRQRLSTFGSSLYRRNRV